MDRLQTYILSVCAAAILCALANHFFAKNTAATIGKMMTGLLLTITVLQPLRSTNRGWLENFSLNIDMNVSEAVANGQAESQKALGDIIKENTEAYILQKASSLNSKISVEVGVSSDTIPIPERVYVSGTIAPYARQQLEIWIERDLGIPKENQVWR